MILFPWTLASSAWWSDWAVLLGRVPPGSSCWASYSLPHFLVSMRMEMIWDRISLRIRSQLSTQVSRFSMEPSWVSPNSARGILGTLGSAGITLEIAKIETYIARKFSACYMTCFVFHIWLCTVPLWEAWGCHGDARKKLEVANKISWWHSWIIKKMFMELYQKLGTLTL